MPEGHFTTIKVAVNQTGDLIATSGFKDPMIAVWDLSTGRLLSAVNDPSAFWGFETIRISPDKKYILASNDGLVAWELYSGKRLEFLDQQPPHEFGIHFGPEDIFSSDGYFYFSESGFVKAYHLEKRNGYTLGQHPGVKEVFTWNNLVFSNSDHDQRVWFGPDSWASYEEFWMSPADTFLAATANDTTYIFSGKEKDLTMKLYLPFRAKEVHFRPGHAELVAVNGENNIAYLFDAVSFEPLHFWSDEKVYAFDWEKRSVLKVDTGYNYVLSPPAPFYTVHEHFLATGETITNAPVDQLRERSKYLAQDYEAMADRKGYQLVNGTIEVTDLASGKLLQTINTLNRMICPCGMLPADSAKKILLVGNRPTVLHQSSLTISSAGNSYLQMDQYATNPSRTRLLTALTTGGENAAGEYENRYSMFQSLDLATGKVTWSHTEISKQRFGIAISDTGYIMLATLKDEATGIRIWMQCMLTDSFEVPEPLEQFYFSDDNRHLYLSSREKTLIYDLHHQEKMQILPGKLQSVRVQASDLLVLSSSTGDVTVFDVAAKKSLFRKKLSGSAFAINQKGDLLATNAGEIVSIPSGSVRKFQAGSYAIYVESNETGEFYFTLAGNRIVATTRSGGSSGAHPTVYIWDVKTGKSLLTDDIEFMESFTNEAADLVIGSSIEEDHGMLIDLKSGRKTKIPELKTGIDDAYFSPDNKYVYTSYHAELKQWEVATGKLVSRIMPIDGSDLMVQLPDNHYMSTPGAAKTLHYVTPELDVVTFEQLDIQYNRPDKVLSVIGHGDTALIRSYQRAYEKRIRRLGIDTSVFNNRLSIPVADIAGRKTTGYVQTNETLTLTLNFSDRNTQLERFNVYVNETPLFGSKGISLRTKYTLSFDTIVTVPLTAGENIIEATVININGTESFRKPLHVRYAPASAPTEKIYFIGIGIDSFLQTGHNLKWSVKDIRDLATSLKTRYGNDIVIDTLFNRRVTKENVETLKSKLQSATMHDKVIISYSGHGLLSNDYDYYLSTFHVDFKKPEENGLPYEVLEGLLDGIAPRKKLMLIDACHSGEVDKEEMAKYEWYERNARDSTARSSRRPVLAEARLGMKNSFELMQELFVNVGRSTGATIISAAAGTQFAQEKSDLQNGVFTYSILEYMKTHPKATVTELRHYVNKRVTELTNGMQVPTTRSETKAVDWFVWE